MSDAPLNPPQNRPDLRLVLSNDLAAVAGANRAFEEFLQAHGVDPAAAYAPALSLEEVLTNVAMHGGDAGRTLEIVVDARFIPGGLVLQVADDGPEFDPLRVPPPDFDVPHEDRDVGGLGIHLLRNIAAELSYSRAGSHNLLTLRFAL